MASISDCIRQMLLEGENVVLPGFGTLKVSENKGEGLMKDGKISPPGKKVVFILDTPAGDDKLAACYSRTGGLSEDEARQQVLELCDAIRFAFDRGETYILNGVGLFSRDDDNKVSFEKDAMLALEPEQFGLSSLDLLELDQEEEAPVVSEQQEKTAPKESPEPAEAVFVEKQEWKEPAKKKNSWKVIWIVTGSLIVILVALLLIPTGNSEEIGGLEPAKEGFIQRLLNRDKQEQLTPPDNTEQGSESLGEENIGQQEENQQQGEEQQENTGASEPEPSYYIIAGSFQNLQNASELQDRLTERGFPAEIIYTENRMYRVSVKSFYDREEAVKDLPVIRKFSGLENAWLLSR